MYIFEVIGKNIFSGFTGILWSRIEKKRMNVVLCLKKTYKDFQEKFYRIYAFIKKACLYTTYGLFTLFILFCLDQQNEKNVNSFFKTILSSL